MRFENFGFNRKHIRILNHFLVIFYIFFIFVWFKDNLHPLRSIRINYLFALIPLVTVVFIQLLLRMRFQKLRIRLRFSKVFIAIFVLIIIAMAFRIPFLAYSFGLVSSDDAVPASQWRRRR